MIRFLKALVLLPVAILVVMFAVANRGPVTVSFDPFAAEVPALAVTMPLFAVLFIGLLFGVVIGGVSAWVVQGKHRQARRVQRRELENLRAESERLRRLAETSGRPALAAPAARV